jgi:hypothetical protein
MKTVKFLVSAIALSALCVACSSNPIASQVEDLQEAVSSKDKEAVIEAAGEIKLENVKYEVLGVSSALAAAGSYLTPEQVLEISDYVKEEISAEYESLADDYVDVAKDLAEAGLAGKDDEELENEYKSLQRKLSSAKDYFTKSVSDKVDLGDDIVDRAKEIIANKK